MVFYLLGKPLTKSLSQGYRLCFAINFHRSSSRIYPWANIILNLYQDLVKYYTYIIDDTILNKVAHNIDLAVAELNIVLKSIKFCAKIWKVYFNPLTRIRKSEGYFRETY